MLLSMASPKVKMINVRLKPSVHDDFKTAADLRGASMSSLMHQFIVKTIREEKEREPGAFRESIKIILSEPEEMTDETILKRKEA